MATGSAAPARADFDALIDPIIQPIVSSLTESLAAFDPAAALDFTSWSDSLLSSLNSIDLALPSTDSALAAAATAAEPAASTGGTIPLTVLEGTEPAVTASIAGGPDVPLLVDTGSSGLVIPYTDLGDNWLTQLEALFQLGFPTSFGESGYSGGVEYIYGVYNDVPVDYLNGSGDTVLATNGPVDVELFSWSTNPSNIFENFQSFLSDNQVSGILGIGENTAGPTTSPFDSYGGVLVNIPDKELIVSATNPLSSYASIGGDPISTSALTETVTNSANHVVGTGQVYDDLDSGGVWGTIPSSIAGSGSLAGDTITVSEGNTVLYSYVVGAANEYGTNGAPTVVSGIGTSVSNSIDSGVAPFLQHPIYIDYAADKTFFDTISH